MLEYILSSNSLDWKKNQPADLRSNKITDDQDKEDQLDEEDLSLVLIIFPKSLYYIK